MRNLLELALVLVALTADAGEPSVSIAARRERNEALSAAFSASCAEVRIWFRMNEDGEPPEFEVRYLCPNCNSYHGRSAESYLKEERPYEGAAFAIAADRFLVQDQRLLVKWIDRLEIVFGGETYPAKAVLRYPDAEALELRTERPVAGVKPLVFSDRLDFMADDQGVFFFSTREDGLSVCGMKGNPAADFNHYADVGKDIAKSIGNAIAVNASNEAVTVSFRGRLVVGSDTFAPPSAWRSEPVEAFDARRQNDEARFLKSCVPLYLHLDDEENRKDGYSRRYSGYRSASESTDLDFVGLALADGEVLAPLNLDASKMSEIDRIEARFADGRKLPMEFVGAFADSALAIFRFADGRTPADVEPIRLDLKRPVERFLEHALLARARNFNGRIRPVIGDQLIEAFRTGRGGETLPAVDGIWRSRSGEVNALVFGDGSIGGVVADRRVGRSRYSSDSELVSAAKLSALLGERNFDPQFAIRKGKDRVRIAWAGLETQRMTDELAREKKATALLAVAGSRGALVTRVWPGTPAAKAGFAEGDILLNARLEKSHNTVDLEDGDSVDGFDWGGFFGMMENLDADFDFGSPWPNVEGGINRAFTRFGIGKKVVVAYVRNGMRMEAELTLEQAPVHYQTAKRIKNKNLGIIVSDMTFEVRGYFKFDETAPGVVVVKVQPGNPAAIGGLRPLEIITHVNNEPVTSAKDFAHKVKGKTDLTFAVRRLAATRIVRIELKGEKNEK